MIRAPRVVWGELVYPSSTPFQKTVGGVSHLQGPWIAFPLPVMSHSELLTLLQHTAVDGTYEYRPRQTLRGVEAQQSLLGAAAPQQRPGAADTSCRQNTHSNWHLTLIHGAWTYRFAPCHSN